MRRFLILAVLVLAGCGQAARQQPDPAPADPDGKEKPAPPKAGKPPREKADPTPPAFDFELSSQAFVEEFKKDAKAARDKYQGKTVGLKGTVVAVNVNAAGQPVVTLAGAPGGLDWAQCLTTDRYPARSAAPGQAVTVKGKGSASLPGAALVECEIVSAKGPRPAEYQADALSMEYADGGSDKHEGKWIALSGVVERVDFDEDKSSRVVFKTKAKPRVAARFTSWDEKLVRPLKPGQHLRVLGEYKDNTSKDEVAVSSSVLMEAPR